MRPQGNKRQAAKALTTSRIADAAKRVFAAKGYDATTIRDVAKASGYSTGAVFNCFIDKADLWVGSMGRPVPDPKAFVRMVARLTIRERGPDRYIEDPETTLESLIDMARVLEPDMDGAG